MHASMVRAPFGSWKSPITADALAASGIRLGDLQVHDGKPYWIETRPLEQGRCAIVSGQGNEVVDLLPAEYSVRSLVHEYGGGAYTAHGDGVFFSNLKDQRIYHAKSHGWLAPITPEPPAERSHRYADGQVAPNGTYLVCVRERHRGREVDNDLVAVPTDESGAIRILAEGYDFYSNPRLSPDGKRLAWIAWRHPNMPWDGCELWAGAIDDIGSVTEEECIAGHTSESIFQPEWSPDGVLHFVSDRSGWWNLYRHSDGRVQPVVSMQAELGQPQWVFGLSRFVFLDNGRIAYVYTRAGFDCLGIVDPPDMEIVPVECPYSSLEYLRTDGRRLYLIAGNATTSPAVIALEPGGETVTIQPSQALALDSRFISHPTAIEFPAENGLASHALYYPPQNPDYQCPLEERPPLFVFTHGGPTSAARTHFSLQIQFWTSRGFAVVDVNYGGSAGYGRAYRERLKGQWGVVDVEDCVSAARYLVERGDVDGRRIIARGSSAGGYTTLRALTWKSFFAAGASYYGIADLAMLARTTHKFESHYLDQLIGPYPQQKEVYADRSPIRSAEDLDCPIILFQGLDDPVVPPSQAEAMVRVLREKKLPHAYLELEGEQHGFRKADSIVRCVTAELYFYGRVFGFVPADNIVPIEVANL